MEPNTFNRNVKTTITPQIVKSFLEQNKLGTPLVEGYKVYNALGFSGWIAIELKDINIFDLTKIHNRFNTSIVLTPTKRGKQGILIKT